MASFDVLFWIFQEKVNEVGIPFYRAVCLELGDESTVLPSVREAIGDLLVVVRKNLNHNLSQGILGAQLQRNGWELAPLSPPRVSYPDLLLLLDRYLEEASVIELRIHEIEVPDFSEDII